jgi:glycosyltransferase involved in cell wall biosynthesis/SAM-dependent methyltransferase
LKECNINSQTVRELLNPSMPWPRISIVTPSYNQGQFIERTVRSVLLQRYPNLEYILMDGGSTDETLDRIAPYMKEFSYAVSQPDRGQAEAIANGLARSSGEIMAYLNSDDLLAPDALYFVANFFKANPNIDWIYSHRCFVDDDDQVTGYWILPPHQNFLMRRWDYIPQETCFWRRSLFEKSGNIDRSYRFAMDYDLFVRFMSKGRGRRLNRFLGAFRDHSTSKTKQLLATVGAREMMRVRQKFMIRASITDGIFGLVLGNWVQYAGRYFSAAGYSLPGGLPGVGYDYNDVWGGLLRSGEPKLAKALEVTGEENASDSPLCPVTLGLADRLLYEATSTQGGLVITNDIFLNSKSGVAIIQPPADTKQPNRQNNLSLPYPRTAGSPANAGGPPRLPARLVSAVFEAFYRMPLAAHQANVAWEDSTADILLALTRGIISPTDEIAFLDAGCSKGQLLDALKARTKWSLCGLEASSSAAAKALAKGHRVFQTTLRQAAGVTEISEGFDLIYLGRGLQCFEEPRASLRTIAVLLKLGGFLVLRTPNLDSEQQKLFGPAWIHWRPEENRFIYSRRSLCKLLQQVGFAAKKIRTVSNLNSTVRSLERLDEKSQSDAANAKMPKTLDAMQAPRITWVSHLVWDKVGKGDEILAVFRRVS